MRAQVYLAAAALTAAVPLSASSAAINEFENLSLEELLDVKVSVASRQAKDIRQSPGIVSIITREEIEASGARDLLDILTFVPGFFPAIDVWQVVGLGVRGNWAHEGKVLLNFDGHEMNEIRYGTLQLGGHYPADLIDRVEILRGPGSAVYGGYAETAVINVTTRRAAREEHTDGSIHLSAGRSRTVWSRGDVVASAGHKEKDWSIDVSTHFGGNRLGDGDYVDNDGDRFHVAQDSLERPFLLAMNGRYREMNLGLVFDRLDADQRAFWGDTLQRPVKTRLQTTAFRIDNRFVLTPRWSLTPQFTLKHQIPWSTRDPILDPINDQDDTRLYRATARLLSTYEITEGWIWDLGVELSGDRATNIHEGRTFANGRNEYAYGNQAVFSELSVPTPLALLSFGLRFDNNSVFKDNLSPRVAFTRELGRWHIKGIWSNGFRPPTVENLIINPSIRSEKIRTFEGELGYRIGDEWFSAVNVFDIALSRPIIYDVLPDDTEVYFNGEHSGSTGLEFYLRQQSARTMTVLSYSFAKAHAKTPTQYEVPGHSGAALGFPQHKVTLWNSTRIWGESLSLRPSVVFVSRRWGFEGGSSPDLALRSFDPAWLVNLNLKYSNLVAPGHSVAVGAYNLLNQDFRLAPPYKAEHASIPHASREFIIKYGYEITL